MKIAVIGAGAMGGAFVEGLLKCDNTKAADITVTAQHQTTLEKFAAKGVCTTLSNVEAAQNADIVVLAVKPWLIESVVNEIKNVMDYSRQTIISVAASLSSEQVKTWFNKGDNVLPQLFFVIPNTAIEQKQSMTFICPVNASDENTQQITAIFNQLGKSMQVDEAHLAAGGVLASCGIAFAMRYIRAASEGGVEIGFKANVAQQIVAQTLKGAVELLQANDNHPEAEIDKVTTPGGLTIRGLNEMEHAGFTSAVIRGLKASM